MDIEIAKMTNATMQSWATKCDANFNGKIDNNEMSVFLQGADSMQDGNLGRGQHVTIGGVEIPVRDIEFVRKDNAKSGIRNYSKSQNDYFVKFTSGCSIKYPEQDENSGGRISSEIIHTKGEPTATVTIFSHLRGWEGKNGDILHGCIITGTNLNDTFEGTHSNININGKRGADLIDETSTSDGPRPLRKLHPLD